MPYSALCGLPQTFKQRLHNSYSYVINAAADYVLLRPLVRNAWCAMHAFNEARGLLLDCRYQASSSSVQLARLLTSDATSDAMKKFALVGCLIPSTIYHI